MPIWRQESFRQAGSDDAAYIEFFKDAPDIARAAAYYNGFIVIKASYEKKDADINSLIISLKHRIKAKEEVMADAAYRIKRINELLAGLAKKIEGMTKKESLKDEDSASSENTVIQRWEKLLNRTLTKPEKYVVRLMAASGEEGLWCLNNTTYGERSLIQKLEALRVAVAKNKKDAEQGADKSLKLMEDGMARRAAMMRYEIRALEQKAIAGLEDADRAMEALKR